MKPTTQDPIQELRNSSKFLSWRSSLRSDLRLEDIAKSRVVRETHYTPQELAKLWNVSVQTIRDVFRDEPGVLKLGSNGTRTRRGYKTLRIPESVVERVHQRLSA
jgi:hypothetical protein